MWISYRYACGSWVAHNPIPPTRPVGASTASSIRTISNSCGAFSMPWPGSSGPNRRISRRSAIISRPAWTRRLAGASAPPRWRPLLAGIDALRDKPSELPSLARRAPNGQRAKTAAYLFHVRFTAGLRGCHPGDRLRGTPAVSACPTASNYTDRDAARRGAARPVPRACRTHSLSLLGDAPAAASEERCDRTCASRRDLARASLTLGRAPRDPHRPVPQDQTGPDLGTSDAGIRLDAVFQELWGCRRIDIILNVAEPEVLRGARPVADGTRRSPNMKTYLRWHAAAF